MEEKKIIELGLNTAKVQQRLQQDGLNEIKRKRVKNKLEILIGVIKDPILLIMLVALIISFITGYQEQEFSEVIVIGLLLIINILISFIQEVKTIQKLQALNSLNEDDDIVIRDGQEQKILSKYLVVGDIVKLNLGIIARADMQILQANNLKVDEAFLTGESDEVTKQEMEIIYANSPITNGAGYGQVVAIGMNTKIGEITKQVDKVEKEVSQLEKKILDISKVLLIIAIITAIIIAILTILNGQSLEETLSITISILIATVPEGLATVLAIVLTFMSQKMANNNALVKKVALLETLGEVEYVCSDKTGTITKNKMKVTKQIQLQTTELTMAMQKIVIDTQTPTSRAINEFLQTKEVVNKLKILDNIPFNSKLKKSLTLIQDEQENNYLICVGAPDFLITNVEQQIKEVENYAKQGLRTLLITYQKTELQTLTNYAPAQAVDFTPIALYGIQDPPKKSAIQAINKMHKAGIKVVMITGDNLQTAKAIAKQALIYKEADDLAITGSELNTLTNEEFAQQVENIKVYARVQPEDKYKIITMLQSKGKIVAMTGDGTNDSIALKKANVGVAMGNQGTDIAKESADLILLDDNFATINEAIAGGRLIFDNLRKFIKQMLTSNTAHVGGILFALLAGLFLQSAIILPMTAVLILWVNVVSDAIPCLALGLDTEETDLMLREPINPQLKLLDKKMIIEILIRGLIIGFLVFLTFYFMLKSGYSEPYARTVAFIVLSFGQLIHIFDARSFKTIYLKNPLENKLLLGAVSLSAILNLIIVYTPLNKIFGLEPLNIKVLLLAILLASTATFLISLCKLIFIKSSKI
ncbi:MAG: cation-translocating P-type ATPase [Mycoplasmatales bacterium]